MATPSPDDRPSRGPHLAYQSTRVETSFFPWQPITRSHHGRRRRSRRPFAPEDADSDGASADGPDPRLRMAAAVVERRMRAPFRRYHGPETFRLASGDIAQCGAIAFFEGYEAGADWLRVGPRTSARQLLSFMLHYWKLRRPSVIISVTGSAQGFSLDPRAAQVVQRGLASAASATRAWVITGGLNVGVMQLAGHATYAVSNAEFECIGFAPWSRVVDAGSLEAGHVGGTATQYPRRGATRDAAALEPHHTRFVLVDGAGGWGEEISLRSAFEGEVTRTMRVPCVLLAIQGGLNTLRTIIQGLSEGVPCLLVSDSGGAAAAVAAYVDHRASLDPEAAFDAVAAEMKDKSWGNSRAAAMLEEVWELHTASQSRLLSVTDTRAVEALSLERHILAALLSGISEPYSRLDLVVDWNRPELIANVVDALPEDEAASDGSGQTAAGRRALSTRAMQKALEARRIDIVETLLRTSPPDVSRLDFARLYGLTEHPFGLFRNDPRLRALRARLPPSGPPLDRRVQLRLYASLVSPFLDSYWPGYTASLRLDTSAGTMRRLSDADLFIWAVLLGDRPLVRMTWEMTAEPTLLALKGAAAARSLAREWLAPVAALEEMAAELEGAATAVLASSTSYAQALELLEETSQLFPGLNIVQHALYYRHKTFVASPYVQMMADEWWRGGLIGPWLISPDASYLRLVAQMLLPLDPFLVEWVKPRQELTRDRAESRHLMATPDPHLSYAEALRRWVHLWRVPKVKFLSQGLAYVCFIALLTQQIVVPAGMQMTPANVAVVVWAVALALHEVHQASLMTVAAWRKDFWNLLDVALPLGIVVTVTLRWAATVAGDAFGAGAAHEGLSLLCLLAYTRLLQTLTVTRALGTLVNVMLLMFRDLVPWLVVFLTVSLGFMALLYGVAVANEPNFPANLYASPDFVDRVGDDIGARERSAALVLNPSAPYWAPFWAVFAVIGPNEVLEYSPVVAPIALYVYMFLATVILINLLIAILTETYSAHRLRADVEWRYSRTNLIEQYHFSSAVPAPMNLIYPWALRFVPSAMRHLAMRLWRPAAAMPQAAEPPPIFPQPGPKPAQPTVVPLLVARWRRRAHLASRSSLGPALATLPSPAPLAAPGSATMSGSIRRRRRDDRQQARLGGPLGVQSTMSLSFARYRAQVREAEAREPQAVLARLAEGLSAATERQRTTEAALTRLGAKLDSILVALPRGGGDEPFGSRPSSGNLRGTHSRPATPQESSGRPAGPIFLPPGALSRGPPDGGPQRAPAP